MGGGGSKKVLLFANKHPGGTKCIFVMLFILDNYENHEYDNSKSEVK